MSRSDREKWNKRYRDGAYATRKHPSVLLTEWLPKLAIDAETPRGIDLACGIGRNALYLAQHGWRVNAVDVSGVALQKLAAAATDELDIRCTEMDLETGLPWPAELTAAGPFDLALMIRYTNLPLIAQLQEILKPGAYLLVEAHRVTEETVAGPGDARFRVAPGALREAAGAYELVDYREGIVHDPDGRRADLARMLARWPGSRSGN
ncbi:MAG: methyltransferase domain-containing protein [Gammaproteobacteria bacterium]